MKKTMRFLSMAALALVGAVMTGCSSDDSIIDNPLQPENKSNVVTLKTTISLSGAAETRALTDEGVKTFAEGEQMAVVYKNMSGKTAVAVTKDLTAGDIAEGGKSATFTVTLDSPDKSQNVTYIYPAAMANADGTVKDDALAQQDGTLASLSSNLDYCTKAGAWSGDDLPTLTLDNKYAILALTLKNNAGTKDITGDITSLTVSEGTNTYTVSPSAAAGPIYVAILPTTSADMTISATGTSATGTKEYTKSLTGKTYEASNGYSLSLKMLTKVTWSQSELESMQSIWNQNATPSLEGITLKMTSSQGSYSNNYDAGKYFLGEFQFSTVLGKITKIEVTTTAADYMPWPNNVWTGNSSTVNFEGAFNATNIIFTIAEEEYVAVSSISLNKSTLDLQVGDNETLTAIISPADATDKSVTWSSNASIATVDANGKVTAVAGGSATIRATASSGLWAECTVNVTAAAAVLNYITINEEVPFYYYSGQTWAEAIAANHPENQNIDYYGNPGSWSIADGKVTFNSSWGKPFVTDSSGNYVSPTSAIDPKEAYWFEW